MPTRRQFNRICLAAAASLPRWSQAQAAGISNPDPVEALRRAALAAGRSPDRPAYHFHPPANYMNDPNGTMWYRGWHHLFYQMSPFAPRSEAKYWGHARSRDLVDWEHLPIALAPSTDKGERSIYSGGSTLGADGKPRLVYTSIGDREPEQWMAYPADDELFRWKKFARNPIVTSAIHAKRPVFGWRDPFLFQESGRTFMVCGDNDNGEHRGGGAIVNLYEATDPSLAQWIDRGVVFHDPRLDDLDIECPNLFRLEDKWVLLISPGAPCRYYVGTLDLATCKFTPETEGPLESGPAYATNISKDDRGRTILWMWGRDANVEESWNGVMVLPRILSLDANRCLRQAPAPEFQKLRGTPHNVAGLMLDNAKHTLDGMAGDSLEILAEFDLGTALSVGLTLRSSADGAAGITVSFDSTLGMLSVGSVRFRLGNRKTIQLRIFLDRSAIDVFVDEGERAIFNTLHTSPDHVGIGVFSTGGNATLTSLTVWPMNSATFSMEHFS